MRGTDLIHLTKDSRCHWMELNCLFKCLCRLTIKKTSMLYITVPLFTGYFWCSLQNTAFSVNRKQLDCLFKSVHMPTTKKASMISITVPLWKQFTVFLYPRQNTAFIIHPEHLGCLFNRYFQLTKMKARLCITGWNWLDSPDKRHSM